MDETMLTMTGRLVERPRRWDFDGGVKATFRLAHNDRRFDKDQGTWVDGSSLYLTVNCWRVVAERVLASMTKGDPVIVRGRLLTREWEKDGRTSSAVELEATSVGPDLRLCAAMILRHPDVAPKPAVSGLAVDGAVGGGTERVALLPDPWPVDEPDDIGVAEVAVGV